VPIEYRWQPSLVHAPSTFTTALFQQMTANSKTGDFTDTTYRPYPRDVQRHTRDLSRRRQPGLSGQLRPLLRRREDGDLAGADSMKYLGFDLGPKGGTTLGPGQKKPC
jgi:hypothetical protein